jgi:hypothetical protein
MQLNVKNGANVLLRLLVVTLRSRYCNCFRFGLQVIALLEFNAIALFIIQPIYMHWRFWNSMHRSWFTKLIQTVIENGLA